MPAAESRLTPLMIERGIPAANGRNFGEVADPLCPGLRVRTTWPNAGARITRFFFRYRHRVSGKLKTARVGVFPDVSLREARRIVDDELRPQVDAGIDVREADREMQNATHEAQQEELAAEAARMVSAQVDRFLASEDFAVRAQETRRSYSRYLEHTATTWRQKTVEDVSKGTVREEFLRLKRTRGHRAAGHWLAANSALWTWMVDNEVTDRHPFRATGKMRREAAAKPSDRWLDDDELSLLFQRLDRLPEDRALALRMMLATGLRPSEVLAGRWEEVDRRVRVWHLPAARMKDKNRDHRVHVSEYLLSLLPERAEGWMFPSRAKRGHVGASDLSHQTSRLGLPDFTAKTLRATAASHWQTLELRSEEPDGTVLVSRVRYEVREAMQHHTDKNPLAKHYQHADLWPEMVAAWEVWGRKLARLEEAGR